MFFAHVFQLEHLFAWIAQGSAIILICQENPLNKIRFKVQDALSAVPFAGGAMCNWVCDRKLSWWKGHKHKHLQKSTIHHSLSVSFNINDKNFGWRNYSFLAKMCSKPNVQT